MKRKYTCFKISKETGTLIDLEWNRYNTEEECIENDLCWTGSEIAILSVWVKDED